MERRKLIGALCGIFSVLLFHSAFAQDSQYGHSISGAWNSDYGQVFLEVAPNGAVSGYWLQNEGTGQITRGQYDGFRVVVFSYFEPWNNAKGNASLNLSADGKTLSGPWSQTKPDGSFSSGQWVLTR